jgi:hypothetical protein
VKVESVGSDEESMVILGCDVGEMEKVWKGGKKLSHHVERIL